MARLHVTLSEPIRTPYGIAYLEAQMKRFDCNASKAIEHVFEEHAALMAEQENHERLIENTYQRFKKDLDITRIRSGHSDKNSQIIIELLNTIIFHNKIPKSILTEQMQTTPVAEAKQAVESRIQGYMERRASKKYNQDTTPLSTNGGTTGATE
ncbi:hypothetical protein [Listeria newyorkensis]|uniref:hypothetical protein n=1 Tax=Listeria newyorkensis TaxID=1497681 RepID=UPI00051CC654|nr:hypothetical protein [Listeria newyorkensis]KGL43611.1 hypothetical protein EP58_07685 [Listeria newyorkensis]